MTFFGNCNTADMSKIHIFSNPGFCKGSKTASHDHSGIVEGNLMLGVLRNVANNLGEAGFGLREKLKVGELG